MVEASFVTQLDSSKHQKLKDDLLDQGFELTTPQYTVFQAKKPGLSVTLYESSKLVVQGKNKHDFLTFYLEPEVLNALTYTAPHQHVDMKDRIGVDEAGKGDYFGPLCIAGVYANGEKDIETLLEIGVKDSKMLSDTKILDMSKKLKQRLSFSIIKLHPIKYNELYGKFHNLNRMLAWAHVATIEKLTQETSCKNVIIDQFAKEDLVSSLVERKHLDINLTQRTHAEADQVVAAASILARAAFVEEMDNLSAKYKMNFPKGASDKVLEAAKTFIFKYSFDDLKDVAKLYFKTTLLLKDL